MRSALLSLAGLTLFACESKIQTSTVGQTKIVSQQAPGTNQASGGTSDPSPEVQWVGPKNSKSLEVSCPKDGEVQILAKNGTKVIVEWTPVEADVLLAFDLGQGDLNALGEGEYELLFHCRDQEGVVGDQAVAGLFGLDLTPPSSPTDPKFVPDETSLAPDGFDDDLDVTLNWDHSDDDVSGIDRYVVKWFQMEGCKGDFESFDFPEPPANLKATEGATHSFQVIAVDRAGNQSVSECQGPMRIDSVAPVAAVVAPPDESWISETGLITSTLISATCSLEGTVRILAGNTPITEWTAIAANETLPFTLVGEDLASLLADGSYDITIACRNKAGLVANSPVEHTIGLDTTPPTAPLNLITPADLVTGPDSSFDDDPAFFFVWGDSVDNQSGIATYTVDVFEDDLTCAGAPASTLASTVTSNVPFTGTTGKSYTFRVTAADNMGHSSLSLCSTAMEIDLASPLAPASPPTDAGAFDDDTVTFNWLAASDVGPSGVAGYEIEVRTEPGSVVRYIGSAGTGTTYDYTGAVAGSYYAKVRTVDHAGNLSSWTGDSDGIIVDLAAPPAPSTPTDAGIYLANTSLDFNWLAVSDVGPAGLSHYNLKIGTTDGGDDVLSSTNVGNVLTYNHTGVDGGIYFVAVQAEDLAGNQSPWSAYSNGITVDTSGPTVAGTLKTPADIVTGADASYDDDLTIYFDWTASSDGGVGFRDYTLTWYGLAACGGGGTDIAGLTATDHTFSATNGLTYSFRIRSFDLLGNNTLSPCSSSIVVDTDDPNVPSAPTDAGAFDDTTITFDWLAPGDVGPAGVSSYFLEVWEMPSTTVIFSGDVGNVLTYDVTGSDGNTYFAKVRSIDGAGNTSAFSSDSDGVMIDQQPPATPAAPTDAGSFIANTSLDFNWIGVSDVGPAGLSHYNIKIGSTSGADDVLAATNVGNVLTYNLTGVDGQDYFVAVQAEDVAGNTSPWSSYSNGITVDTSGPVAATGLITPADLVTDPDSSFDDDLNIFFKWSASTDAGSGFRDYTLTWYALADCAGGGTDVSSLNALDYGFAGSNGSTYSFEIRSFDQLGNSTLSGCSTSLTIDSDAPTTPATPTDAGVYDDTTVTFDWVAVSDVGPAGLSHYILEIREMPSASVVFSGSVGNVVTYDHTGTDGSSYFAKVRSVDSAGNMSPFSSESDGVTIDLQDPPTPGAPTDDGVYYLATNLTFNWGAVVDVGPAGLSHYNLKIGTTPGGTDVLGVTNVGNVVSYNQLGSDGVTYYAAVQAVDNAGNTSAWSANSNGVGVDLTDPVGASNLRTSADVGGGADASYDDDVNIFFSWDGGTDSPGLGIASYTVRWYSDGTCSTGGTNITGITGTSSGFTGANNGTYSFEVTTIDHAARSVVSGCSSAITILTDTPTVDVVSVPTESVVSVLGTTTNSNINVTCSMSGSLEVLDNTDDDEIVASTPVTGATPELIGITGTALDTVTGSDGPVTLKVICRNLAGTNSAPNTARVVSLDTIPPDPLTLLSAATGAGSDGDIDLTITYPGDTSDYEEVRLRRLAGAIAPNGDCTSDGTQAAVFNPLFSSGVHTDATGSSTGEYFSYRVCIYDAVGHLTASDAVTNIQAQDTNPPPALSTFSVVTGASNEGDIDLSWTYGSTLDYDSIDIRALSGATAPSAACNDGVVVTTITSPFAATSFTDATGSLIGDEFSYRACIYDTSSNLTATNVATGIPAKDTVNPMSLTAFSGVSGSTHGDVDITINFPGDTTDYDVFTVRRIAGGTAPNAACSNGTEIYNSSGPFNNFTLTDATGANYGESYSYRACIWDTSSNLNSSNTSVGVAAVDTVNPPDLTSLAGVTGSGTGEIDLTVDFPGSILDYNLVQIRQLGGVTPPSCASGTVAKSYSPGQFTDDTPTITGLTAGAFYSYRACVYDGQSNSVFSRTVANVQAKAPPCTGSPSNGYCWHLVPDYNGANCQTWCASRGGCNQAGNSWAAASEPACQAALSAVGHNFGSISTAVNNFGCKHSLGAFGERGNGTAPCNGPANGSYSRVCACNN